MNTSRLSSLASKLASTQSLYEKFGENSFKANIDIGNEFQSAGLFSEAAEFFDAAYQINKNSEHALLAKVRALIKIKSDDIEPNLEALRNLDDGFYRYARAEQLLSNGSLDKTEALNILRNSYEAFNTGSEPDWLFISLTLPLLNQQPSNTSPVFADIIPRRLYFYWDKNPPSEVVENIEYHRSLGVFDVALYSKEEACEFLELYYGRATRNLFLQLGHPSAESDFFRFHVIYQFGGYYLDVDEQVISTSNFFEYLKAPTETVFFLSGSGPIHSAFFGSVRQSPILAECITTIVYNSFNHKDLSLWLKTGPGPITRATSRAIFRNIFLGAPLQSLKIFPAESYANIFRAVEVSYRGDVRDWRIYEAERS